MKKFFLLVIIALCALAVYWFTFHRDVQDPHYDAAVCVAAELPDTPGDNNDFSDKVRTVILNENNSYSLKRVSYDERLGESSIKKYQRLSAEQKKQAANDVESCITIMTGLN